MYNILYIILYTDYRIQSPKRTVQPTQTTNQKSNPARQVWWHARFDGCTNWTGRCSLWGRSDATESLILCEVFINKNYSRLVGYVLKVTEYLWSWNKAVWCSKICEKASSRIMDVVSVLRTNTRVFFYRKYGDVMYYYTTYIFKKQKISLS